MERVRKVLLLLTQQRRQCENEASILLLDIQQREEVLTELKYLKILERRASQIISDNHKKIKQ